MKIRRVIWPYLWAIMASGCSSQYISASAVPSQPPTHKVTSTELLQVEVTPSPMLTPILTVTSTLLPTVSSEDRDKLLAELLKTNGNCSKPCFWGISPNTSEFDATVAFLKSLGRKGLEGIKDSARYYNVTYNFKEETSIINVVLLEKNEKLAEIGASMDGLQNDNVSSSDWAAFRPDHIIDTYGTPSSVKIILGEGPYGGVNYQLMLIYDDAKLSILYDSTDMAMLPTSVLHTCPLAEHGISDLELWLGRDPKEISKRMKEIEEVSPLTVEDFSKLIIDKKEQACFDISLRN